MPVQTTNTSYIYFPDGAKVQVKESGAGSYTDIGAMIGSIACSLTFSENQLNTANAGFTQKQIREMQIDGSFTLINLNQDNVERLGGGMFSTVDTAGGSVSSIDDQVIASGAATNVTPYELVITETGGNNLRVSSSLVIASVTGSTDGALAENDDYTIIDDSNSYSGKSIVFNTAGSTLTTLAQTITIAYTSVTPVATTVMYAGASTQVLSAYALKFTHTDSAGLIREFEIYSCDPNSGGFQFNFKGADEDGVEEMPITFTGRLDTTKSSGQQLFAWTVNTGAA